MDRELNAAIKAARDAGAAIKAVYDRGDWTVTDKEGGKGPLTEADLAADEILVGQLSAAFPGDGILSEERADDHSRLTRRRCWIIDPLDGTREFTMRMPEFAVSVALVEDGEARLGVVYNPITNELITGVVGRGAFLNGQPVRVRDHATIAGARFLVSRSEHGKGWFDAYEGVDLVPLGSVAYKVALVATGRADAVFTPKPRNEWDLAGGVACVLAAGGRATDGSGAPYRFNRPDPLHIGVCVTNGAIHDAVLGLMQR